MPFSGQRPIGRERSRARTWQRTGTGYAAGSAQLAYIGLGEILIAVPDSLRHVDEGAFPSVPAFSWIAVFAISIQKIETVHVKSGAIRGMSDQDATYQKKFIDVPNIIADWVGDHDGLAGRDVLDFGCGDAAGWRSQLANMPTRFGDDGVREIRLAGRQGIDR